MDYFPMITGFLDCENVLTKSEAHLSKRAKRGIKALYKNNYIFKATVDQMIKEYCYSYGLRAKTPWGSSTDLDILPGGLKARNMKLSFLFYANVVLLDGLDVRGQYYSGKYALPGKPAGKGFNLNGDPLNVIVNSMYNGIISNEIDLFVPGDDASLLTKIGVNGELMKSIPKAFMVWDNEARSPFAYQLLYSASCITDCYRTLDVTRFWLKRPVIFTADEELIESINDIIEEMENNEAWTIQSSSINEVGQATNLMNTNVNGQNLSDVTGILDYYWAQWHQLIGINSNSNMDKKGENLIEAEVTVNDESQKVNIEAPIETKNKGFKEAAPFFGIELEAVPRVGQPTQPTQQPQQEGDRDNDDDLQRMD